VESADLWLHLLAGSPHRAKTKPKVVLEVFDGSGPLPHLEVPVDFGRRLHSFLVRT
jgi:pimeloyl-ACP methyl ester carboxylesterase